MTQREKEKKGWVDEIGRPLVPSFGVLYKTGIPDRSLGSSFSLVALLWKITQSFPHFSFSSFLFFSFFPSFTPFSKKRGKRKKGKRDREGLFHASFSRSWFDFLHLLVIRFDF